jgi:hypothetical protein
MVDDTETVPVLNSIAAAALALTILLIGSIQVKPE